MSLTPLFFYNKAVGRKLSPVPIECLTLRQKCSQAFIQKKDRHTIEKTLSDKEIRVQTGDTSSERNQTQEDAFR